MACLRAAGFGHTSYAAVVDEARLAWTVIGMAIGGVAIGTIWRKLTGPCATKADIEKALKPIQEEIRAERIRTVRIERQLRNITDILADLAPGPRWSGPPDGG